MTRDTRIALFLMGELLGTLRANDSDLFKRCLQGRVQDLGEQVVEELRQFTVGSRNSVLFVPSIFP